MQMGRKGGKVAGYNGRVLPLLRAVRLGTISDTHLVRGPTPRTEWGLGPCAWRSPTSGITRGAARCRLAGRAGDLGIKTRAAPEGSPRKILSETKIRICCPVAFSVELRRADVSAKS